MGDYIIEKRAYPTIMYIDSTEYYEVFGGLNEEALEVVCRNYNNISGYTYGMACIDYRNNVNSQKVVV